MKRLLAALLATILLAALVWGFYMRDRAVVDGVSITVEADAPLRYVPADTPFVVANLAPIPDAVVARWDRDMAGMQHAWQAQFEQLRTAIEPDAAGASEWLAMLDAVKHEFRGKSPREAAEAIGFGMQGRFALYGLGAVPVLRIELADPARLRAFIERLEQAGNAAWPHGDVDGQRYWRLFGDDAARVGGLVAIVDGQLVASVVPREPDRAALREVLGLDRPSRSMAESGELQRFNAEFGYTPFLSGFVDSQRLLAALIGPATALDQTFSGALGVAKPSLQAPCDAEWQALAAAWPRLGFGYRQFSDQQVGMHAVLQARPDIAAELMKLRAPIAGLSAVDGDTVMHFGIGLNMAALPEVVGRFADQVEAEPWSCDALAPMNEAFVRARREVASPVVYAAAPVLGSMHVAIDDFQLDDGDAVPRVVGRLVVGSDNPEALIGMARQAVPALAGLPLEPGQPPRLLPPLDDVAPDQPIHVAVSDAALGLSIGRGAESRLPEALTIDPSRQPLLVAGVGPGFHQLLGEQMARIAASQQADADPAQRDRIERESALMRQMYGSMIESAEVRLELTARGIEVGQHSVLR